jgi:hypothetical protein
MLSSRCLFLTLRWRVDRAGSFQFEFEFEFELEFHPKTKSIEQCIVLTNKFVVLHMNLV